MSRVSVSPGVEELAFPDNPDVLVPQQPVPTLISLFSYLSSNKEWQEAGSVPPLDLGMSLCEKV